MIRFRKNNIVHLLILLPGLAHAQFKYKCSIETPDTSGFFSILVTPALSSHTQTDLSDIRIMDNRGRWVPHVVRENASEMQSSEKIVELKVLSIQHSPIESIVTVGNDEKRLLNNLLLRLKNAAAERMTSLSGSADNKNWFIISDSILLAQALAYTKDENVKQIHFPATAYRYLKLSIRNSGKDPLNLLSIASSLESVNTTIYPVQNPTVSIKQIDSARWSLIHLTNNEPYQLNQLRFDVRQPALYERTARVYLEKKGGILRTWESYPIAQIKISSASHIGQALPLMRARDLFVVISNEDNPPLEITAVKAFQPAREIIAYLQKGVAYSLILDDPNATQPNYDLKEFSGQIPNHPQILQTSRLVSIATAGNDSEQKPNKWWIWIAITGMILLVAYLTWQLSKDMSRKKEVS